MATNVAILCIGSEVLDGRVLDTNSQYLGEQLTRAGYRVTHTLTCDDVREEIIEAAIYLLSHVSVVCVSGGLGPTEDDLTRDAAAALAGTELELNDVALAQVTEFFESRNRKMLATNKRQAFIPRGAEVLQNKIGTAPGFKIKIPSGEQNKLFFFMPGVPHELKLMFDEQVLPSLVENYPEKAPVEATLRTFGIPESVLGEKVEALGLPETLKISYRARFPEVTLLIRDSELSTVNEAAAKIREALGREFVYSTAPDSGLAKTVHDLLTERGLKVSFAESCTGGLVAKSLSDFSGSSAYLMGSAVTYSNEAKSSLLGVSEKTIEDEGAVSHQTAYEMAEGSKKAYDSDISVSITGIAGPGGGTDEKPVGTFFVGLSRKEGTETFHCFYPATREGVRRFACFVVLDIIRRTLLGLPAHEYFRK